MGIFTELRKSHRNREDYKAQVVQLQHENHEQALEIARLGRKLLLIDDYIKKALA